MQDKGANVWRTYFQGEDIKVWKSKQLSDFLMQITDKLNAFPGSPRWEAAKRDAYFAQEFVLSKK